MFGGVSTAIADARANNEAIKAEAAVLVKVGIKSISTFRGRMY